MTRTGLVIFIITVATSCSNGFLAEDPGGQTSQKLSDLEGLLKDELLMAQTPVIGEQSSTDYYLLSDYYNILGTTDKNLYTWEKDIYGSQANITDWNTPYTQVYNCNVVLDELANITANATNRKEYDALQGYALFMRAYAFHNIAQVFAKVYDKNNANIDLGIAMPLKSDITIVPPRSSMKESYDQITGDLLQAAALLPVTIGADSSHLPNKPAAFALLARVYLGMQDYDKALSYADSTLAYASALLDFNTVNLVNKFPVSGINQEILYMSYLNSKSNVIQGRLISSCIIDSDLYNSYDKNDIRKDAFFMQLNGLPIFKANYTGMSFAFSGLALDETILIRAECRARKGNIDGAMQDVNYLLKNRYRAGTFVAETATTAPDALAIIWRERRKELVFRGLRWTDLKRLNKENHSITLSRTINGVVYNLPPSSNRYVLPIPANAIQGTSIEQNDRN